MVTYLDAQVPEDLCKHLFLSFMKKPTPVQTSATVGKDFHLKDVAAVTASQTVCAPITHLGQEIHLEKPEKHHGLAEKIHGLTEKLHGLSHLGDKGHSRHDSGDSGRRSRAGTWSACTFKKCVCRQFHVCLDLLI